MSELRTKLLGDGYRPAGNSSETHQYAEANRKKNEELRKAFNIRDDYVDGSSFNVIGRAMETAKASVEKEER